YHCGERFATLLGGDKRIDARLPAVGRSNEMTVGLQRVSQRFNEQRIVVHDEMTQALRWQWRDRWTDGRAHCRSRSQKQRAHRRAFPWLALDFNLRAVTLYHAIDHRQAQTGSSLTFGSEKWLQAASLRFFIHPNTGVANFQAYE